MTDCCDHNSRVQGSSRFYVYYQLASQDVLRNVEQVLEPCKVDLVEEDEILVLEFSEKLPIGDGVLAIGFEGTLNDKMKGFYRRYYYFHLIN